MKRFKSLAGFILLVGSAIGLRYYLDRPDPDPSGAPLIAVAVPPLDRLAQQGAELFGANCASCHGANAAGKDGVAPPLVHIVYEPSHHGDAAFLLAAQNGVRQHHWRFGNMPPVEGVRGSEIDEIVAYVRALQRANGID